jgi:hypothetical protein
MEIFIHIHEFLLNWYAKFEKNSQIKKEIQINFELHLQIVGYLQFLMF